MPDNLQAIRDYASSLQGDERKAFIDKFNSIKDDDTKVNTLVSRISGLNKDVSSQPEPQSNGIASKAMIGAGIAGAGALAYGAVRAINKPYREMKPLDAKLRAMASQIPSNSQISTSDIPKILKEQFEANKNNIPLIKDIDKKLYDIASGQGISSGSSIEDIPMLLKAKQSQLNSQIFVPSMNAINANISNETYKINNSRKLFEQQIINPKTDEIAKYIIDNHKEFTNSGYASYRNAQSVIESIIEKSGKSLQADDVSNFLNNAYESSKDVKGIPQELLGKLKKVADSFSGSDGIIEDLVGNKYNSTEAIQFSKIKGNVDYLLRELPDGARHAVAEHWNNYIDKYVPSEARAVFNDMQSKYAPFAQARNTLFGFMDKNKGSFNTKILSERLQALAKNNKDAGLTQLLDSLGKGTEISKPITGLNEKIPILDSLRNQRNDFSTQIEKLKQYKLDRINEANAINSTLQQATAKHESLMLETKQLLSERNSAIELAKQKNMMKVLEAEKLLSGKAGIAEKYPWRMRMNPKTLVKGVTGLAKLGGKLAVGLPFGVVASEAEKRGGGYDPAEAFQIWLDSKKPEMTEGQIEKLKAIGWIAGPVGYMIGGSIGITAKEKKATEEKYQRMYQNAMGI